MTSSAAAIGKRSSGPNRVRVHLERIGVVGLGTIGREELALWHRGGFSTVGVDVHEAALQAALPDRGRDVGGRLVLTLDAAALRECDAVVLALPTADPDGSISLDAFDNFAERKQIWHRPGQLLIIASTVPIGFSRRFAGRVGTDHLAHAPERYDPGRPLSLGEIPRLVAGLTEAARDEAIRLLQTAGIRTTATRSLEVAESAKILENAFRLINIAFINEFAVLCQRLGLSAADVVDAAATKPFAFMAHYPGPGAGGTCIPIVPRFLLQAAASANVSISTLDAAVQANDRHPAILAALVDELVGASRRASVLVVGATYKANQPDVRGSRALAVIELLARSHDVTVLDPYINERHVPAGVTIVRTVPSDRFDLVVIAVRHDPISTSACMTLAPQAIDLTRGEAVGRSGV